jgi:hypothetical protein
MPFAADAGPGGLGALIFVVFFVAAIALFIAMSRSMKRMRSNVDRGKFGGPDSDLNAGAAEGPGPGSVEPGSAEQTDRPRGDSEH